mgnify:CR=1 FL=1
MRWPVQVLALLCPERQTDLSALCAGKCDQVLVFAWFVILEELLCKGQCGKKPDSKSAPRGLIELSATRKNK